MEILILIEAMAVGTHKDDLFIFHVEGYCRHLRTQGIIDSRTAVGSLDSREEYIGRNGESRFRRGHISHLGIFGRVFDRYRHLSTLIDDTSDMCGHVDVERYGLFWQRAK